MIKLKKIQEADVKGKKVFLRADLDVPLEPRATSHEPRAIDDETRLNAWFPTLEYLLGQGAKVIIAGHMGRPKEQVQSSKFKVRRMSLAWNRLRGGYRIDLKVHIQSSQWIIS